MIDWFNKLMGWGRWEHTFGGVPRSSLWPKVRAEHIKKEPSCQLCGGTTELNVHHILPFHVHPQLELDPTNLITLCNGSSSTISCHIRFGHFDSFKDKWNPNIKSEAPVWRARFLAKDMTSNPLVTAGDQWQPHAPSRQEDRILAGDNSAG